LRGSFYSKGTTEFSAKSNYKKRYRYGGYLHFERNIYPTPQEIQLAQKNKSWNFRWEHATENNRYSSWYIQVDLEHGNTRAQNDFRKTGDKQIKKDSSIRYQNKLVGFPLPYTLNSSLRLHIHNSHNVEGAASASLPEVSLSTTNMYPFRKRSVAGTYWYSDIYLQHTLEFQNKLSNSADNTLDFFKPKDWPVLWKNRQQGVQHTLPLQTNIKILSYLNLTPKVTYQEQWYWEQINYKYDAKGVIREDKIPGFVRVYNYNFCATLKTTFYGTHVFGSNTAVQAIRHQINPKLSFTYTPDFSDPKYGYWQTIKGGNEDGRKFNRFKGAVYESPGERATAVLAVNLNNRLDMKLKSKKDAQKRTNKVPILESFDWSTSYNFLADQHALGDIHFKTRTKLFDKLLDISFESAFDPYFYDEKDKTRSNEFAWNRGKGLGHMKNASLSIGTELGPKGKVSTLNQSNELEEDQETPTHPQEDATQYVNFKIPSNLALDYRWGYSCPKPWDNSVKTNSLSFKWCINLTEKWTVTCKSAYDLNKREFIGNSTNIGVERDLHCWKMDFQWNPLGENQTYKFSVGLKAAFLKDIEYSRNNWYKKY
jgi:hypothetical protein